MPTRPLADALDSLSALLPWRWALGVDWLTLAAGTGCAGKLHVTHRHQDPRRAGIHHGPNPNPNSNSNSNAKPNPKTLTITLTGTLIRTLTLSSLTLTLIGGHRNSRARVRLEPYLCRGLAWQGRRPSSLLYDFLALTLTNIQGLQLGLQPERTARPRAL